MIEVKEKEHAKDQARAQLESIKEMVKALNTEDDDAREEAQQTIHEDALSVEVRSGWSIGPGDWQAEEYRILLCTGGPAVQIVGDLSQYGEPASVKLQYQDWFTPWMNYDLTAEDEEVLITYARQFYFTA